MRFDKVGPLRDSSERSINLRGVFQRRVFQLALTSFLESTLLRFLHAEGE